MFTTLLITHFLGDFVLQTDEMAKGKSSSMKWLALHIGTYSAVILITAVFFLPWWQAVAFAAFNGGLHMLTDYFTSRMSSKLWAQGRVHDFFVVIGADQLIHVLTLYWSYVYVS